MDIIEYLYDRKKKWIKKIQAFYKSYFTVEGTYTSLLPDKIYIKKLYKKRVGKELDLKNPITFTEKLNWLKLYDRCPEYTTMVDKYASRDYVKEKIDGSNICLNFVPLLGVWDKVNDIDFDSLPNQFVLKPNHCSDVVICRDKQNNDYECKKGLLKNFDEVKAYLDYRMKQNYYKACREWPYKNIKRKIICEQFMENTNGDELLDYKFFCFNGEPKLIMLNSNRFGEDGLKTDMYDINWCHLDMSVGHYPQVGDVFNKPKQFDEMVQASKLLSKEIPFVRVDFNVWNHKMYFGELTFFDSAGYEEYHPSKYDRIMGDWLILPQKSLIQI